MGLKQEISQQVREFRAQKLNLRGCSPGPAREHNQPPGQGHSKGSNKCHKKHSSQGPVGHKQKARGRPLSSIQDLLSPNPQIKEPQPFSQSTGQVQKSQSGSITVPNPAAKLVSARSRGRSHSPCCRIDVDIEPEYNSGWSKGMRPALSSECLMVPSDWEVTEFDLNDPLSQSFPVSTLQSALSNSYSPASNSSSFLQVPDENMFSPPFSRNISGRYMLNAIKGSSSMSDLSASAPADILSQNLAECKLMNSHSSERLTSSFRKSPASWLGISPSTSPQTSPSYSTSSSPRSSSTFSPPFSPDNFGSTMRYKCSPPSQTYLLLPDQDSSPLFISPASSPVFVSPAVTPHCSPHGSPFGSQTQICSRSVGAES